MNIFSLFFREIRLDVSSESSARQRIHMKNQALYSSKDKSKKLKCRLLQFLFGALLRINGVETTVQPSPGWFDCVREMLVKKDSIINISIIAFQDSELNELRATIEALKRQSGISIQEPLNNGGSAGRRHTTPGMLGKDLNNSHGRVFHTLPMPTGNLL